MTSEAGTVPCKSCGRPIRGDFGFCPYCGAPARGQAPSQGGRANAAKARERAGLSGLRKVGIGLLAALDALFLLALLGAITLGRAQDAVGYLLFLLVINLGIATLWRRNGVLGAGLERVESFEMKELHLRIRGLGLVLLNFVLLTAGIVAIANPWGDLLFVLAVAPSAFLLWHFHHADRYKAESPRLLLWTFVYGGLTTLVAAEVENVYYGYLPPPGDVVSTFLFLLLGVGLVEEGSKFLAVRRGAYKHFDETMDGIIFGIAAGLGFATVENIAYVSMYGAEAALIRAVVSVPGHAFWAAIMGYYLARSKLEGRPILAVLGLALAVFFHGLFDTLATEVGTLFPDTVAGAIVGLGLLAGLVWMIYFGIVRKEVARARLDSAYRPHQ